MFLRREGGGAGAETATEPIVLTISFPTLK